MSEHDDPYQYYKGVFRDVPMPFAFVDLDFFDANIQKVLARAEGRPIRVASKSVRCRTLLRRIQAASPRFGSIMAYSVREAVFLARNGFDDILVAYPAWGGLAESGLCGMLKENKTVIMMIDCAQHAARLESIGAAANVTIPVCMDVDMSVRAWGIHFGVRRSGIRTPEQAVQLWHEIAKMPHLSLAGIMGYEAQVASIPDHAPGGLLRNRMLRHLKRRSIPEIAARRAAVLGALREAGCVPRFINGGGTGSLESTRHDETVTEITAGSAFFAPALFDHFAAFKHKPAAGFAVEIVRQPAPGCFTCLGGGYAASGAAGADRLPIPWLPHGMRLTPHEGAGETQTPVLYDGPEPLALGDPVIMRHAKAGELCERFNTLHLLSQGRIVGEVPTYRGEGMCFL